jgi:hypothetical protein
VAHIRVRTLANGERRYNVRWRLPDKTPSERTFHRRHEAEAYKRKIEADELVGVVTDMRGESQLFKPFADRWLLTRLVKGRPLAPMTVAGYRGLLRRNIYQPLGQMLLRQITPDVVREWHADVVIRAGQDQAAKSYRLLRAILNTAVDDGLIRTNPCRVKGGGGENADERPMTDLSVIFDLANFIQYRCQSDRHRGRLRRASHW